VFGTSGASDAAPSGGSLLTRHVLASIQPAAGVRRLLVYSFEGAALTSGVVASIPFTVGPEISKSETRNPKPEIRNNDGCGTPA